MSLCIHKKQHTASLQLLFRSEYCLSDLERQDLVPDVHPTLVDFVIKSQIQSVELILYLFYYVSYNFIRIFWVTVLFFKSVYVFFSVF